MFYVPFKEGLLLQIILMRSMFHCIPRKPKRREVCYGYTSSYNSYGTEPFDGTIVDFAVLGKYTRHQQILFREYNEMITVRNDYERNVSELRILHNRPSETHQQPHHHQCKKAAYYKNDDSFAFEREMTELTYKFNRQVNLFMMEHGHPEFEELSYVRPTESGGHNIFIKGNMWGPLTPYLSQESYMIFDEMLKVMEPKLIQYTAVKDYQEKNKSALLLSYEEECASIDEFWKVSFPHLPCKDQLWSEEWYLKKAAEYCPELLAIRSVRMKAHDCNYSHQDSEDGRMVSLYWSEMFFVTDRTSVTINNDLPALRRKWLAYLTAVIEPFYNPRCPHETGWLHRLILLCGRVYLNTLHIRCCITGASFEDYKFVSDSVQLMIETTFIDVLDIWDSTWDFRITYRVSEADSTQKDFVFFLEDHEIYNEIMGLHRNQRYQLDHFRQFAERQQGVSNLDGQEGERVLKKSKFGHV